jgi:DNA-binding transcriptional LysR family regulator
VRDKGGYTLTALAAQLAEQVDAVCGAAERLFAASTQFDPATSEREFTLVMADYTIGVMGEALSQLIHQAAPRARLHIRLVRESLATEHAGAIRFVDGMVAPPAHGFARPDTRSAELFRDRWVCLVAACNPVLDAGELRLADIARLPWVAPYYRGAQSAASTMRQFTLLDIQPHIAVRVESYLAVPHFVAGADRVALMPERLAARLADRMDLRVMECPGPTEPIAEALWWHRQHEDDIAHAWLRRLIVAAGRGLDRPPVPGLSAAWPVVSRTRAGRRRASLSGRDGTPLAIPPAPTCDVLRNDRNEKLYITGRPSVSRPG